MADVAVAVLVEAHSAVVDNDSSVHSVSSGISCHSVTFTFAYDFALTNGFFVSQDKSNLTQDAADEVKKSHFLSNQIANYIKQLVSKDPYS